MDSFPYSVSEMENSGAEKDHIIVFPMYGQGHINPMVQFSKHLASKGLKITVATVQSLTEKVPDGSGSVKLESIYDDCNEGLGSWGPGGFKGFLGRFVESGSWNLTELIRKLQQSEYPVKCLIYDANLPWALDIAKQFGIFAVAFFTQSCAAIAAYYPLYLDLLADPLPVPAFPISGLPEIKSPVTTSFGCDTGRYSPIIIHILEQFNNIEEADCVLFNSFCKLEEEVVEWMSNIWPVRAIGPTVPSLRLDQQLNKNNDYGFDLYQPVREGCLRWLETKGVNSVVYVSFGSVAIISADQMVELAKALKQNDRYFLWVVRTSEQNKLLRNFVDETLEKGLVVTWCPQLEVLSHPSVGCFITHCGWNSTVEAINFGVPMVAMPQFLDQTTNAHFVEKVWEVGITTKVDEKGVSSKEEIERCVDEIMQGERGRKIKENSRRWKELAKEAVDESGSSDKQIDEFIALVTAT